MGDLLRLFDWRVLLDDEGALLWLLLGLWIVVIVLDFSLLVLLRFSGRVWLRGGSFRPAFPLPVGVGLLWGVVVGVKVVSLHSVNDEASERPGARLRLV